MPYRKLDAKAVRPAKVPSSFIPPKVKIDWAYVDVKGAGRVRLNKIVGEDNATLRHRVPITLTGFLDTIHSRDDGVSQEFAMTVTDTKIGEPERV